MQDVFDQALGNTEIEQVDAPVVIDGSPAAGADR
jgi:hypothetical protein